MSDIQQIEQAKPVHMLPKTGEELEREALKWCEKLSRKLDNKRSKAKRRGGGYADHR
ncbi:hypothetical protein [Solidesulfovibrio sp.]